MSNVFEFIIEEDCYIVKMDRKSKLSRKVFCGLLEKYDQKMIVSDGQRETGVCEKNTKEGSYGNDKASLETNGNSVGVSTEDSSNLACDADAWRAFESKLDTQMIKNEAIWCLVYAYFLLGGVLDKTIERKKIRECYKVSNRYSFARNKDYSTNLNKCSDNGWIKYDKADVSLTEEGKSFVETLLNNN